MPTEFETIRECELRERCQHFEQQLRHVEQQLRHAQKLTAIGELASTTTHEFNNVLMAIINYAKMGLRHEDSATRTKSFEKILAAGNRASKITNSVLGMARNRSETAEPTDLAELIEQCLILLEKELQKYRIHIERRFEDVPKVMAIGNQIQQVALNLIINARQAMPDGGDLTIRLVQRPESDLVDMVIRDSGKGIPADKLPRIFDPYFTTKKGPDATGKGGTGLGLALCQTIIESHRGRIRVESSVGKGTCFTIRLPVSSPRNTVSSAAKGAVA